MRTAHDGERWAEGEVEVGADIDVDVDAERGAGGVATLLV